MLDGEKDSLAVTSVRASQADGAQATLKGYLRSQPVRAGMGGISAGAGQASMTSFLKESPGLGSAAAGQKRPFPDSQQLEGAHSKLMRG